MTMNGRRLSVVLAGVLLMGVMVALGITQATAQDNPNSQPSTSNVAAAGSQSVQSTTLKKVLWAVVNSDGTLARGKGAVSATALGVGNGLYGVRFDRDVRRCVYTATIGRSADGVEPPGEITVALLAVPPGQPTNGVFVTTHNSAGTSENRGFHLALNCPGS